MIGQAHVTEPLMTALRTERIGHAYLFSGPRGCGKTTSARILARCLNCAEGPTDTPCGTCPSCVELSREGGGSLDVVEIDAASHGGVDDARDLRERAVFAPARDRFKIFIIDEAHMVTSGGFNALLKIVEEPPPHVKFIFATTEPEKVIGTIRSRTHHYPFRLIAPGTLIDYVQQLCDTEGVQIEAGVLPLVVRAGGGSVRDTLSILDQLIAGSESGAVSLARATGLLGYTSTELLDEVTSAFGARDAAAAFAAADRVVQTGQDPRRFVEDLLERLRDLIVISATTVQGASTVFRGVPDDQLQRMFEQSQPFSPGELSRIADTVSETLDRMNGATAPRLHLELMVARALVSQQKSVAVAAPAVSSVAAVGVSVPAAGRPAAAATPPSDAPARVAASGPAAAMPAAAPVPASAPVSASSVSPAAAAPAETAAAASPAIAADAVDIVATMKSAREFLRSGSTPRAEEAPAQKPVEQAPAAEAPIEGASAAQAPVAQQPTLTPAPAAAQSAPPAAPIVVNFDELEQVWPELLEEILSEDRDAWNAVTNVVPLQLDGDVLTVGMRSRSDLDAFKALGANVLRDAIEAALGITVKYKPTPIAAATPQRAGRESATDAESSPTTSASAQPGEPAAGGAPDPALTPEAATTAEPAPEPTAEAMPVPDPEPMSEPEPGQEQPAEIVRKPAPAQEPEPMPASPALPEPGTAPALAQVPSAPRSPANSAPETDPEASAYDPDFRMPNDAYADDAYADDAFERDPSPVPAPASAPGAAPNPEPTPEPELKAEPVPVVASEVPPMRHPGPAFEPSGTRYGESVVREILGARFIEERPLPQDRE